MTENSIPTRRRAPWNRGRLVGQKRPLKPKDVWTIRVRLQMEGRRRDLAMFNLAIAGSPPRLSITSRSRPGSVAPTINVGADIKSP